MLSVNSFSEVKDEALMHIDSQTLRSEREFGLSIPERNPPQCTISSVEKGRTECLLRQH